MVIKVGINILTLNVCVKTILMLSLIVLLFFFALYFVLI